MDWFFNKLEKVDGLVDGVKDHLKFSPRMREAAVARFTHGSKVLAKGGYDKVFEREFPILPKEKLIDGYVCYISTCSGPVIGTIFVSNKRLAFCSDFPLRDTKSKLYKVEVKLQEIRSISPSANAVKPSERYIHVVTDDGIREFWLMGFVSYKDALTTMMEALLRARPCLSSPSSSSMQSQPTTNN